MSRGVKTRRSRALVHTRRRSTSALLAARNARRTVVAPCARYRRTLTALAGCAPVATLCSEWGIEYYYIAHSSISILSRLSSPHVLVVLFWPKLGLLTVGYYYKVYVHTLLHSVLGDKAKQAQCTCLVCCVTISQLFLSLFASIFFLSGQCRTTSGRSALDSIAIHTNYIHITYWQKSVQMSATCIVTIDMKWFSCQELT